MAVAFVRGELVKLTPTEAEEFSLPEESSVINVMRERMPARIRELKKDTVHGVKLDARYRLAKVRFSGRWWIKVWAIRLPARPSTGKESVRSVLKKGKWVEAKVTDPGAPERYFVLPCPLFPCGGSWSVGQAYFL